MLQDLVDSDLPASVKLLNTLTEQVSSYITIVKYTFIYIVVVLTVVFVWLCFYEGGVSHKSRPAFDKESKG